MSEWGSWGANQGAGGEPPPPTEPWGAPSPPGGPYEPPPAYPPQQSYPPGAYQQPPPYQQDPYQQDPYQQDPYYGQYQSGGWEPPQHSGGSSKGPLIIILVVLAVIAVGGVGFFLLSGDDDDDPGGQAGTGTETTLPAGATTTVAPAETTTTAPAGGEGSNVFVLSVGQCWNDPGDQETLSTVEIVPCDQPHDLEVYDAYNVELAEFPGQDAIAEQAQTDCEARFEEFVGIPYNDSQYYAQTLTPSEESWAGGDREVLCSIYDQNGPVTGSLAGAGT